MKGKLFKKIAAGLCLVLTVSALAGCGGGNSGQDKGTEPAKTSESQAVTESGSSQAGADQSGDNTTGEVTQIVMAFPTAGVEPADLGKIQDRVNEITREKIGVEVTFKPVSLFDAVSQIPMWIGGGERLRCV